MPKEADLRLTLEFAKRVVEKGLVGDVMLIHDILFVFAENDRDSAVALLRSLELPRLVRIMDYLHTYPHTDRVWDFLPVSRNDFNSDSFTTVELMDLDSLRCKEDREIVEFLRQAIRDVTPEDRQGCLHWGWGDDRY